jgi:hypothetical protein
MAFDERAFFTEKSETRPGLPNEEELEREINPASGEPEPSPDTTPQLPARFTRKSSGWK